MPSFARYIIFAVWQIYHIAARRYIIGINLFHCYNKIGVIDVPENKLVDLSFEFAKKIVELVDSIKTPKSFYMVDQLARAGTSVGANIHEAQYAQSKADFIAKLEIALKEANETSYWLKLLFETKRISEIEYQNTEKICGNIRRLLIASCSTAKTNLADK